MRIQTGASVQDNGAKFIWYDQIDEILSLTAKANGVSRVMDQGMPVPDTGTSSAPTDGCEEADGHGELSWVHSLQRTNPEAHNELTNRATTPLHKHEHRI